MNAIGGSILAIALVAAASPSQAAYDARSRSVVVPRVEARAVKLDGTFSPGEWDSAIRFAISKDVELYLVADDEALRVGLKYAQPASSVDLFLTSDRREFLNLHASMALGETRLAFPRTPETGLGRLEMGRHVDWDANPMVKTEPPVRVDGFEFRILRKRLGADVLRLALQTWSEDKVGYPAAADLRSADGWVELVLPQVKAPAQAPSGREDANKALVRRYFDAMADGDLGAVRDIFSPGCVMHHTTGRDWSLEETIETVKRQNAQSKVMLPDLAFKAEDVIAQGDKAVLMFTFTGTHRGDADGIPATGNAVAGRSITIFRFEDGKIAEGWQESNVARLYLQLGFELKPKDVRK